MATTSRTGEIVRLNLDPVVGGEKGKTRPCLIVQGDPHPWGLVIVVPITEFKTHRDTRIFPPIEATAENGLAKKSAVDCFQVRCVSTKRIGALLGRADAATIHQVRHGMSICLDIGASHLIQP
jgi:mRNA interferase MazF